MWKIREIVMIRQLTAAIFLTASTLPAMADEGLEEYMPFRAYSETPDGQKIQYGDGYQTLDECKTAIIDFQRQVLAESEKYDDDNEGMGVFLHAANQIRCFAIGKPA
jgi:hypothetical protein